MSAFTAKNIFVNPFYQEGVGRRTGIVLNKDVRKDSDGFEVFDDYWSESENDATVNTTYAADKENNGTKPSSRRKKSSLKSMPAFSPPVTSSEREESKVELPREVSQAAEDASTLEADITGSIIKGPPTSLEPSSALREFKTRQRLSFSEATSSEESQTTEGDGSVGDEGESQESGTSSEGTVKAPSSQSEHSQEERDSQAETEDGLDETGTAKDSEKQSSQTTSEPSLEEEEVHEPEGDSAAEEPSDTHQSIDLERNKDGAPSSSQESNAQIGESKRRSTRGKSAEANLQDETTKLVADQDATIPEVKRSRKSTSQSKEDVIEKEVAGEEDIAVEAKRRKSTRQSESKRRSNRGKTAEANSQDETTKLVEDQDATIPEVKGSRKSTSQSKEDVIEKEVAGEEEIVVETKLRKSTRQSRKMTKEDLDEKVKNDTETGRRKSTRHSNVIVQNETELEKDNEKKAKKDVDTRRRKSSRQSNRGEKKEEDEKEKVEESVKTRRSRSTRQSNRVENIKDDVKKETENAKTTQRRSKQQSNVHVEKVVEEEKDQATEDEVTGETKGEKVGGAEADELREPVTETEEEAGEIERETEAAEVREPEKEEVKSVEVESEEAMETEAEKTGKTEEENVKDTIVQKDQKAIASRSDVSEDEDDDTERVFFSLRASMAVPSVCDLEDEFNVSEADAQEFGTMDDTLKRNDKNVGRTSEVTIAKGGKKNDKESREGDEQEQLKKSTRKPSQKGKQERKKGKEQKKRGMKRGSEVHKENDQKKTRESPKERADGDKDDSIAATGGNKSRGKKSNKQKDRLQRRTSSGTSQESFTDTDAGSQLEDDLADTAREQQKNQRKRGRKKTSSHLVETSETSSKANDKNVEIVEDGHSTSKAGSSTCMSRSHRSRRSSVHFTTKDMISVSGDISIHQVTSSEEDSANNKKAAPTPAALLTDKKKTKKSSNRRSSGAGSKTPDMSIEDDTRKVEGHRSGQSESDGTSESEKDTSDVGKSRRGRKGRSKAKKPSKRRSTEATSATSVAEAEGASGVKKRRLKRREQEGGKSSSGSQSDASDGNAEDHTAHVSLDAEDIHHNQSADQSTRGHTPDDSPISSTSGQQESRSLSTHSILKVSQDWGNRRQTKNKKYSILFTEKPLPKAYIIPPDEEDGVRRTRRQRVRPLEYWRNERPLYERRKSGGFALAGILSPEAPEEKVSVRSMRAPAKPKGHLAVTPSNISIHATPPVGTSTVCQPTINVVNPDSDQEVAIDAVATSKMLKFTGPSGLPAKPEDPITISKALSQKAFSAGVLKVRPFEEKGSQLVRRDTMVFYVVRGKIAMTLHKTSQILQNGDWFFVPKGNVYNIKNLRKDEAKLTFFQLKSS